MASTLMKKKKNSHGKKSNQIVIGPIWWRQLCFSLFILILGLFFAFVSTFGELASWVGTLVMISLAILNFLDQLVSWSSLRIDKSGYKLQTWWRRKNYAHYEIKDFETREYAQRKLIVVILKQNVVQRSDQSSEVVPFPCAFGRPVEEVLGILRSNLDKSPRSRESS